MSSVFVGLCIFGALALALLVGARYRFLVGWMVAGWTLRVALLVLGYSGLMSLPYVGADGAAFTERALTYSEYPLFELLGMLDYRSAHSYSVLGALLYKTFGFSELILPSLNLLLGVANTAFGAVIAYRLFGRKAASTAAMLICLYPFTAINSVAAVREELSIFFFLAGLFILVGWIKAGRRFNLILSLPFLVFAAFVHPGWVAAILGLVIYFVWSLFRDAIQMKGGAGRAGLSVAMGVVMVGACAVILWNGVELGKGVEISSDLDSIADTVAARFQRDPTGGSAFPAFVAVGDPFTQPWLIPLRVVYFLYSPFPWDVRSAVHLLGLFAGVLYAFLTFRAYKSYRGLKQHRRVLVLHSMLVMLTLMFALGVTNSGTAIRHKAKFYILLVVAASPTFRRAYVLGGSGRSDQEYLEIQQMIGSAKREQGVGPTQFRGRMGRQG